MGLAPTAKVTAAGLTGATVSLIVWGGATAGLEIPPHIAASAVTVISGIAAWITSERGGC